MNIERLQVPCPLTNLSADLLAFDVEMANSFRNEPPVICMVGMEHYDRERACCVSSIASITRREEERELVEWFLSHLREFHGEHPQPKLLTFSGTDNDLPWMRERFARYGLPEEQVAIVSAFEHVDLKQVFYRRTQNINISLKKLEERFGIQRQAQLTSKKVSYLLTHVLSRDEDNHAATLHSIAGYLREDVHNLLVIRDRWEQVPLDGLALTEMEFLNQVISLLKLTRRLVRGPKPRARLSKDVARLEKFAEQLEAQLDASIRGESLREFALPKLPSLSSKSQDVDRLIKKYVNLKGVQLVDPHTGEFRLARSLDKPMGVLAVVRREGKVLMIRRAATLKRAPGYWGLPGGGLEKGETPAVGAVRELWEELHLQGQPGLLLGTSPSMTREFELFWVEVEVEDLEGMEPRPEEVAEARWVGPQELRGLQPLIPGAVEGFQRFLGTAWGGTVHVRR